MPHFSARQRIPQDSETKTLFRIIRENWLVSAAVAHTATYMTLMLFSQRDININVMRKMYPNDACLHDVRGSLTTEFSQRGNASFSGVITFIGIFF